MAQLSFFANRIFLVFVLVLLLPNLFCGMAQSKAPVRIIDDAGIIIELTSPAQRVIPLYAGLSEILDSLGLAHTIIARTVSDDILPQELPVVGTHMRPNQELIVGLKPDLVVQLEGREEAGLAAEYLTRHGIPVARFRVHTFEGLFSCIQRLGILTGTQAEAKLMIADMQSRLEKVRQLRDSSHSPLTVFFEVRYPNLLGAGGGSMVSDIIEYAGGRNCLEQFQERMVRLNEETLLLKDPDVYLIQYGPMNKSVIPLEERAHYRNLSALKKGYVKKVPESVYSRPGPQSIIAVEELAGYLSTLQGKTSSRAEPLPSHGQN